MAQESKTIVKPGDIVQVVLADRNRLPAKILRLHKNGTADLEFAHRGELVQITSSPFDETGQRPDCWCAAAKTAPAQTSEEAGAK